MSISQLIIWAVEVVGSGNWRQSKQAGSPLCLGCSEEARPEQVGFRQVRKGITYCKRTEGRGSELLGRNHESLHMEGNVVWLHC